MHILNSKLASHYLTMMRDINTSNHAFHVCMDRLSEILAIEVVNQLDQNYISSTVNSPLEQCTGLYLDSSNIVLIPLLRAGMGLVPGFKKYLPDSSMGFIAEQRNEKTAIPEQTYCNLPDNLCNKTIIVLDPMLATGGSAIQSIDSIIKQDKNINIKNIIFVSVLAAQDGINNLLEAYPDLTIYTVSIDKYLNDKKYIVPGLGDAGDRLFGC